MWHLRRIPHPVLLEEKERKMAESQKVDFHSDYESNIHFSIVKCNGFTVVERQDEIRGTTDEIYFHDGDLFSILDSLYLTNQHEVDLWVGHYINYRLRMAGEHDELSNSTN